jgi:hypothetical protein
MRLGSVCGLMQKKRTLRVAPHLPNFAADAGQPGFGVYPTH